MDSALARLQCVRCGRTSARVTCARCGAIAGNPAGLEARDAARYASLSGRAWLSGALGGALVPVGLGLALAVLSEGRLRSGPLYALTPIGVAFGVLVATARHRTRVGVRLERHVRAYVARHDAAPIAQVLDGHVRVVGTLLEPGMPEMGAMVLAPRDDLPRDAVSYHRVHVLDVPARFAVVDESGAVATVATRNVVLVGGERVGDAIVLPRGRRVEVVGLARGAASACDPVPGAPGAYGLRSATRAVEFTGSSNDPVIIRWLDEN